MKEPKLVVPVDKKPTVEFVCGLEKTGPGAYRVVSGKIVDGVKTDWKTDSVSQPLEFAALTLTMKLRGTISEMP